MTEKEQQTLDKQITLTEQKLLKAKKTYDALLNQMNDLLTRRYPERQEAAIKERLYHAFLNSNKDIDEIVEFMEEGPDEDGWN